MKKPNEIIKVIEELCGEAGYHYLIQIDDGENINGKWSVVTDSRLHNMARAVSKLSDTSTETTYV